MFLSVTCRSHMIWKDHVLNIVDTHGHDDFIGEVHQAVSMAEGAIFVVDVNKLNEEVRFVAQAASRKLNVVVLLNRKLRVEMRDRFWELLVDSDAPEDTIEVQVLHNMPELLDAIIDGIPAPTARVKEPFLVSMIHKGDNWGRFMIGKITSGVLAHNQKVKVLRLDIVEEGKVLRIRKTIGLESVEVDKGCVGDIISVAVGGLENVQPSETLADIHVLSINRS
ncbi:elongation factor family protein [Tanacetum coccineum]|uniref:Elongation factor family protein n=1 Tax=Tanacetum coccineum TaxID=301880 RepID=A0ABQ5D3Q8_9ASTR